MLPMIALVTLLTPVSSTMESNVITNGGQIRQFAFDGDPKTSFVSLRNARKDDQLTLVFDRLVELNSINVGTGRNDAMDELAWGELECSTDGKRFEPMAKFMDGKAAWTGTKKAKAIRIRVTEDQDRPLAVREITITSLPVVKPFQYPVEIALDVADAPEMKEWAEKVARICEQHYAMICTELASENYRPPTLIRMALKRDYKGVAEASGSNIRGSVAYFKEHPDDIGAMIHETVHCVQNYRRRGLPGWLVEGIADYIRFWKYEPGRAGRLNPERARYDGSYRTTAAFLAYLANTYDSQIVKKLNAQLREGKFTPESWSALTGKSVDELNQDWRRSLVR